MQLFLTKIRNIALVIFLPLVIIKQFFAIPFPGVGLLIVASGGTLALVYASLGLLAIKNSDTQASSNPFIRLKQKIMRLTEPSGIVGFSYMYALPFVIMGTLFKSMSFPGSNVILITGAVVSAISIAILLMSKFNVEETKNIRMQVFIGFFFSLYMLYGYTTPRMKMLHAFRMAGAEYEDVHPQLSSLDKNEYVIYAEEISSQDLNGVYNLYVIKKPIDVQCMFDYVNCDDDKLDVYFFQREYERMIATENEDILPYENCDTMRLEYNFETGVYKLEKKND